MKPSMISVFCFCLFRHFQIEREKKQARQQKLLIDHTDVNEKDGENGTLLSNSTTANVDSLA